MLFPVFYQRKIMSRIRTNTQQVHGSLFLVPTKSSTWLIKKTWMRGWVNHIACSWGWTLMTNIAVSLTLCVGNPPVNVGGISWDISVLLTLCVGNPPLRRNLPVRQIPPHTWTIIQSIGDFFIIHVVCKIRSLAWEIRWTNLRMELTECGSTT